MGGTGAERGGPVQGHSASGHAGTHRGKGWGACPHLVRRKNQGLHILNTRRACPAQCAHLPGEETEARPGGDRKSSGMGAAWPGQSSSPSVCHCVASDQPGPLAGRPTLRGAAEAPVCSPPPRALPGSSLPTPRRNPAGGRRRRCGPSSREP